jgi:hypothetical protein
MSLLCLAGDVKIMGHFFSLSCNASPRNALHGVMGALKLATVEVEKDLNKVRGFVKNARQNGYSALLETTRKDKENWSLFSWQVYPLKSNLPLCKPNSRNKL